MNENRVVGVTGRTFARIVTSAIGIPILTYAALANSLIPIKTVCAVLAVLCTWEFMRAEGFSKSPLTWIALGAFPIAIFLSKSEPNITWSSVACGGLILVAMGDTLWKGGEVRALIRLLLWILLPFINIVQLRAYDLPNTSNSFTITSGSMLMLFFLCLWGGDSASFFIGSKYGKRKIAPNISPQKTWEGAVANFITSLMIGILFGSIFDIGIFKGAMVGGIVGIFGQIGDFVESAWKRTRGIKDSGNLLPGHGGILDRCDSWIFSAPFVALFLSL
ncbi:MAG TPA: phosphatidate cytidylyltransferase [Fimbriimonadales bacterium]|nr:phosphatidate cytidylyltransferase [Fimbriimonadales bacterium]